MRSTAAITFEILLWTACSTVCCANDIRAEQKHWAFQPIRARPLPLVKNSEGSLGAIDALIQARLEQENIAPSAEADRTTLIRRVTLDLIGLPPTLEEVSEFLQDNRPDAYQRLVERLLASPHYGERWARVWLDLCHYGDSDGHLTDQLRPVAWRYRDWVMRALNANMSFDEFTIAQIAGDLVAKDSDFVLGTGFLRQTLSNREGGADLEEYRVEQIVDRTSMVGTIWLGLTVGCARCHDHKFDPLTQQEFFSLYAFFDRADEVNIDAPLPAERDAYVQSRPEYERRRLAIQNAFHPGLKELQQRWERACLHAAAHPGEDHVWDRQWELLGLVWGGGLGEGQLEGTEIARLSWENRSVRQQNDLLDYFLQHGSIVDEKRFAELKLVDLRNQLIALKKEFPQVQVTRAPVMQASLSPRETFLHERGDFRSHGARVEPGTPSWLPELTCGSSTKVAPSRLDLAQWLVARENPLTSRVAANRMWQEFFGRGLVGTSNDFGTRGDPPSHPALLDFLAEEFIHSGWDIKRMHRLIVTSATYRQTSRTRPELEARDPNNLLLARQASLRVPAEIVRDLALAVSGRLSTRLGGPSVFPPQHERVTMEAFGSNSWKTSEAGDRYRRGLYTFILRTSPFAQAILFDAPNPQLTCTRRDRSNTPLQALTLLNDPVFGDMAQGLSLRIRKEGGASDEDRIRFAWKVSLCRSPTVAETNRLVDYLMQQRSRRGTSNPSSDDEVEWTHLASVLFNLHEFITRD